MKEEKKKKLKDDEGSGPSAAKKKRSDDSPSFIPQNSASSASSTSSQASATRSSSSEPSINVSTEKKISKRNATGETMLILMAKKGDLAAVKSLVKGGANLNEQDYAGWTALHESCIRNFPQVANYLLRQGANVHLRGLHGDTALHDAARHGFMDVVRILMRYGSDPYLANEKGERPVDVANSDEMLKLLKQGSKPSGSRAGLDESDQSESESDISGHTFTEEAGDNAESKRVKDPYAFEDEEPDDGRSLTSPIKLRINKDSGQYAVQSSSSGGSVDLNLSASNKDELPQEGSTSSVKDDKKDSDCLPKLDEEIHHEEDGGQESTGSNKTDGSNSSSSDEASSHKEESSSTRTTKNDEAIVDQNDSISIDSNNKQKVPPLRIKLAAENEKMKENDNTSPVGESSLCAASTSSPAAGESNAQLSASASSFTSAGNLSSSEQPADNGTISESSGKEREHVDAAGIKQEEIPSTSEKRSKSGRTLRSHTAAQREKEEKEKVDSAPLKKRKVRSRPEPPNIHESASVSSLVGGPGCSEMAGSTGPAAPHSSSNKDKGHKTDPPENPYEKAEHFNKQIDDMIARLVEIQPKAPNGYADYLMVTHDYLLARNVKSLLKKRPLPKDLLDKKEQADLFNQQEEERLRLALKHQSEREHLRLCAEQEVIRSQNKAALALATKNRPFSFCSVITYMEHTYSDQIKTTDTNPKEEESSVRDRFTSRTFIGWLKDTKDKFDKEKRKLLCRQLHESESLMMVQKLDWEIKLKELLIDDFRVDNVFRSIPSEHVPLVDVPVDFVLFKHDPYPS